MLTETLTRTQLRWFLSLRDDGEAWFDGGPQWAPKVNHRRTS
jgi:hypothetical protein